MRRKYGHETHEGVARVMRVSFERVAVLEGTIAVADDPDVVRTACQASRIILGKVVLDFCDLFAADAPVAFDADRFKADCGYG